MSLKSKNFVQASESIQKNLKSIKQKSNPKTVDKEISNIQKNLTRLTDINEINYKILDDGFINDHNVIKIIETVLDAKKDGDVVFSKLYQKCIDHIAKDVLNMKEQTDTLTNPTVLKDIMYNLAANRKK
mmetsp:Transcript_59507/g.72841  ORF Transcript_59507/g.72841 Transcript_59507/m.72841 type:complete len:129 (-) Transcript_59507:86-472(-)